MRITHGPYKSKKDGRWRVRVERDNGSITFKQYSKFLMEQFLCLDQVPDKETVDHKDGNIDNNELVNLQILSRPEHSALDALRVELVEIECVLCGAKALKKASVIRHNSKQGKAGPFCGKKCSGKYGALIQNGSLEKLPAQPSVQSSYYTNKDNRKL